MLYIRNIDSLARIVDFGFFKWPFFKSKHFVNICYLDVNWYAASFLFFIKYVILHGWEVIKKKQYFYFFTFFCIFFEGHYSANFRRINFKIGTYTNIGILNKFCSLWLLKMLIVWLIFIVIQYFMAAILDFKGP